MIYLFLVFLLALFAIAFVAAGLWAALHGAPFVPSSFKVADIMIKAAGAKAGKKIADLGSGDGRIVIALALAGADAVGYEINPFLVWYSRFKIWRAGLTNKARIQNGDIRKINYSQFNAVTIYTSSYIMQNMEDKLHAELPKGTRVVSNSFQFENWPETKSFGKVYVYTK